MKISAGIVASLVLICLLICPTVALEGSWSAYNGHYSLTDGAYTIEMWNYTSTNFTWIAPNSTSKVHYLLIGNAGSGGTANGIGGGGGAGGFVEGNTTVTGSTSYSITIGQIASNLTLMTAGNVTALGFTAYGGGNGRGNGDTPATGVDGASGGGAGGLTAAAGGSTWDPLQGNAGGAGSLNLAFYGAGGGGGASSTGHDGTGAGGGNGGDGRISTIVGFPLVFSAGGGGSYYTDGGVAGNGGSVGACGGNAAGGAAGGNGQNGTMDHGCGGGGGGNTGGSTSRGGGFGSTGVVILRYKYNDDFAANVTYGSIPLAVRFSNTTLLDNYEYASWDFGDGTTLNSTELYVDHTYGAVGVYTVSKNASIGGVFETTTKTNYIAAGYLFPSANFAVNATVCAVPCAISFTDTSTNSPTAWVWDFGDRNQSTSQNPTWTYDIGGWKNVNLTVTNVLGASTVNKTNVVYVAPRGSPLANFTASPLSGSPGMLVTFTDLSTGGTPTAWYWDFGDGSTSNLQNPPHVYPYASTYTVTLSVQNAAGYTNVTKINYISVAVNQDTKITYPPKDVRFHLQELSGAAITGATVTATPFTTSLGTYTYVASLFGYDLSKVPLSTLTLSGTSDSRGDATFAMMTDVQYAMTFTKSGYSFSNTTITPHDDNYIIYPTSTGSIFVTNGTAPSARVTYGLTGTRINKSVAVINVSYIDVAGATNSGKITLVRGNKS